jgi:hypothetical protein
MVAAASGERIHINRNRANSRIERTTSHGGFYR